MCCRAGRDGVQYAQLFVSDVCVCVLQRVAACCREEWDSVQYAQLSVSDMCVCVSRICVCVFPGEVCILTH